MERKCFTGSLTMLYSFCDEIQSRFQFINNRLWGKTLPLWLDFHHTSEPLFLGDIMPKGIRGFQKGNTEGRKTKGEKNGQWLGDKVGYPGVHLWVRKYKKKPKHCEICHKKTNYLDLANKDGNYQRNIKDYSDGLFNKRQLCKYLSEDLSIIAMTIKEFTILIFVVVLIGILIYKL